MAEPTFRKGLLPPYYLVVNYLLYSPQPLEKAYEDCLSHYWRVSNPVGLMTQQQQQEHDNYVSYGKHFLVKCGCDRRAIYKTLKQEGYAVHPTYVPTGSWLRENYPIVMPELKDESATKQNRKIAWYLARYWYRNTLHKDDLTYSDVIELTAEQSIQLLDYVKSGMAHFFQIKGSNELCDGCLINEGWFCKNNCLERRSVQLKDTELMFKQPLPAPEINEPAATCLLHTKYPEWLPRHHDLPPFVHMRLCLDVYEEDIPEVTDRKQQYKEILEKYWCMMHGDRGSPYTLEEKEDCQRYVDFALPKLLSCRNDMELRRLLIEGVMPDPLNVTAQEPLAVPSEEFSGSVTPSTSLALETALKEAGFNHELPSYQYLTEPPSCYPMPKTIAEAIDFHLRYFWLGIYGCRCCSNWSLDEQDRYVSTAKKVLLACHDKEELRMLVPFDTRSRMIMF